MENCYDLDLPPDIGCVKYGTSPITELMYSMPDKPLVVAPPLANETVTLEQKTATEIARRMALPDTNDEKIYAFSIKKGQMPFSSPVYKTDPHRNVKIVSEIDTPNKIEWTDYRDNDPLYDFYSSELFNHGKMVTCWAKTGKKLIGGFNGLLGSFTSMSAVVEGAEMNSQIKAEFNWMGSATPPRVSLP